MSSNPIDDLLADAIRRGDFPSAVYLVAEGGRVRFSTAHGHAVRTEAVRIPATLKTIYDLASLTKPLITALLVARLHEAGAVELDESVAAYLPEFDKADKQIITVRHLLTHTSGLPAWLPIRVIANGEPQNAITAIADVSLAYGVGEKVVYSDLGFITLGRLIERVFNLSLPEIARREIFIPLNLTRSFFNPPAELKNGIAASESNGNEYERQMCRGSEATKQLYDGVAWRTSLIWGEVHDGNACFFGGAAGHAGLFSTASETMRLAEQFIPSRTQLLRPATCALFNSNMTTNLNEARSAGWQLAATPDSTAGASLPPDAFGHTGFAGTSVWIDARQVRIYVLLTNRTHDHPLPFANINSVRRRFHTLAAQLLDD